MKTERECCGKPPVKFGFHGRKEMIWIKCTECGRASDGKFSLKKAIEAWNALFEQQTARGGV